MQTFPQQCPSFQMAATRVLRQGGEWAKMTHVTVPSLLHVPSCTFPFKMLNTRVPPCRADLCTHTTWRSTQRTRRTLTWKRVPSTSKQLANSISLAATPRNPDQDWTFCEHNRNTEATQLIQILSYARTVIKINFPGRQHQPTRTKKVGGKDKWAWQPRRYSTYWTEGLVHRLLAQPRRLVQQEHAAPPRREFRSVGKSGD